ncbi:MAG: molybdopterin-dependent oxidoreductase, partial [Dehalococcoidia bacterium]|nr:molybdopterin-dependent oxidoreductase [Dehalococcoidia bacterium]
GGGGGPPAYAIVRLNADGTADLITGTQDIGTGTKTVLTQIVAEELEAPFDSIDVYMGITGLVPFDRGTHGSWTIRMMRPALQKAAASARETLLLMAAERWNLPPEQLQARDGTISAKGDPTRRIAYGELSQGKPLPKKLTGPPATKPVEQYRLIGRNVPRVDLPAKVTGKALYAADMKVPGMLHGKMLRPPSLGAKPGQADFSAARRQPGVIAAVQDGDYIGVVAETEEQAEAALEHIKVSYKEPEYNVSTEQIWDYLKANSGEGLVIKESGSPQHGFHLAEKILKATYKAAYLCHAVIEREAAIADVTGDGAKIWITTSVPFGVRSDVALVLGMPEAKVQVVPTEIGGGFGRKNVGDAAIDAARLSRAAHRPVQVVWSREEDFTWGPYRSAAFVEVQGGIAKNGALTAWEYHVYSGPHVGGARARYGLPPDVKRERAEGHGPRADSGISRAVLPLYNIPNQITVAHASPSPLRTTSLRSLGAPMNCFAQECLIDELAEAAGMDPVQFRLSNLTDKDTGLRGVIEAAARKACWKPGKGSTGQGRGFACSLDSNSWIAEVVEVEVDRDTGKVRVKRVVAAQDSGLVINPDGVHSQMESGIVMGCSATLNEGIQFKNGHILNASYLDYPIFTMMDAPTIELVIVPNPHMPAQGAGEPAFVPIPAAIANAIYNAVGARVRELPITPAKVLAAMPHHPS